MTNKTPQAPKAPKAPKVLRREPSADARSAAPTVPPAPATAAPAEPWDVPIDVSPAALAGTPADLEARRQAARDAVAIMRRRRDDLFRAVQDAIARREHELRTLSAATIRAHDRPRAGA